MISSCSVKKEYSYTFMKGKIPNCEGTNYLALSRKYYCVLVMKYLNFSFKQGEVMVLNTLI